jgi:hypothetical protein
MIMGELRRLWLLPIAFILSSLPAATPAAAQGRVSATAPAGPGTAQRRAILNALRPAIERRLDAPVEFVVDRLTVHQGWALVFASPQRPGGGQIDGRRYFPNFEQDMDGLGVSAILRFRNGRWQLVEQAIGATEAWYCYDRAPYPRPLTGC